MFPVFRLLGNMLSSLIQLFFPLELCSVVELEPRLIPPFLLCKQFKSFAEVTPARW